MHHDCQSQKENFMTQLLRTQATCCKHFTKRKKKRNHKKPMHCCRALARNAQYCSSEPSRIGCYWMHLEGTLLDIDRSFLCYRLSLISNERIQCFTSLFSKRRKRQVQNQQVDFGTAMVAGNHLGRLEVAPFWTFALSWNHQDSYLWRATHFGIHCNFV